MVLRNGSKAKDLSAMKERGMTQNSSPWLWQIHSPFIHRGEDEDRASSQLGITVHQVDICSQSFLCALRLHSL